MNGFRFTGYKPDNQGKSTFERLLDLLMQLLTYTNGDFSEAMQWMNELDKQYNLTDDDYGMGDFLEELRRKDTLTRTNKTAISASPQNRTGHP